MTVFRDHAPTGVHIVPCRVNGPRGIVKAFLVTAGQTVLIDTGFSDEDADAIAAALARAGRRVKDIDLCIVTHQHTDHIGGLKRLHAEFPFPVLAHRLDADAVQERTGVPVERRVDGDTDLSLCDGLRVLHLPGHTPGSLAVHHEATRSLFAGDVLFSAGEWLIPSLPYLSADWEQAVASVRRLISLGLDIEHVLVAHGEDVHGGGAEALRHAIETRRSF